MNLTQLQTQHFYLRAGFGEPIDFIQTHTGKSKKDIVEAYFKASTISYKKLAVAGVEYTDQSQMKKLSAEEKRNKRKDRKVQLQELKKSWMLLIIENGGIREKMALFWHNHFACKPKEPQFAQQYIDIIRRNAMGSFEDMLFEISKSPAMLNYLNNKQNVKKSPNENFAREVMELFTIGRGYYTEDDIKNAARAFTGWSFNKKGEFVMRENKHDFSEKTFFDETGKLEGEDILKRLLQEKQTAVFLSAKLYRYLVNYHVHEARVNEMAEVLYNSNYNIEKWLRCVFMSDWFYEKENIGCIIKSPIEYIANVHRQLNLSLGKEKTLFIPQKKLGQELLSPPNVAGWRGGRAWIDNSTLVTRQNWASDVVAANIWYTTSQKTNNKKAKGQAKKTFKKTPSTISWKAMETALNQVPENQIEDFLKAYFFQTPVKMNVSEFLEWDSKGVEKGKHLIPLLMKLPEYQLA